MEHFNRLFFRILPLIKKLFQILMMSKSVCLFDAKWFSLHFHISNFSASDAYPCFSIVNDLE